MTAWWRRLRAKPDNLEIETGAHATRRIMQGTRATGVEYRYLPLPHRGKGSAVRSGVLHASGDPIVFLDARKTPTKPTLLAVGDDDRITGGVHSNEWPKSPRKRMPLIHFQYWT